MTGEELHDGARAMADEELITQNPEYDVSFTAEVTAVDEANETTGEGGGDISDSLLDTWEIDVPVATPTTIKNGLQLKLKGRSKPFACFTYAVIPGAETVAIDSPIVPEGDPIQGDHIQCHQVKEDEKLSEIFQKYGKSEAAAVVLINVDDNFFVPSLAFHEKTESQIQSTLPLLLLTSSDGKRLLRFIKDDDGDYNVYAVVEVTDCETIPLEVHTAIEPPCVPIVSPMRGTHKSWERKSDFCDWLQQQLYTDRGSGPVCISEDHALLQRMIDEFMRFEMLKKHTLQGKNDSVNSKLLKVLTTHRDNMMSKDFPFYLLIVHRMDTVRPKGSRHYFCKELMQFIYSSIEKLESLERKEIAHTMNLFLEREHSTLTGGASYQQIEKASLYLMDLSSAASKKSEEVPRFFHKKYVYCKMLWISIAMKLNQQYSRRAADYWREHFIQDCKSVQLHRECISEIADGLHLGNLLELRFRWMFTLKHMAELLTSDNPPNFSQLKGLLLAVSPHILLEADVGSQTTLMFLRELHDQYSTMINSPGGIHEHLYETGEEHRVIDDGLQFVETVLKMWKEKGWDPSVLEKDVKKWLTLLLDVINFKTEAAPQLLKSLIKCHTSLKEVRSRFQSELHKMIIKRTQTLLPKLDVDHVYSLYQKTRIWRREDVEELLVESLRSDTRILNKPWPQFLAEVTVRHPGASGHEFLLEFLRAVGHCYEKSYPDLFVLDMLKLNVPLLFAHSRSHLAVQSAADKDVHIKFITNLCEYILKNNMQEKLLGGMQTILNSLPMGIKSHTIPFQDLVLQAIQKLIIPNVKAMQTSRNDSVALEAIVNCLVDSLQWEEVLSAQQRFCWYIVNTCCSYITASNLKLQLDEHSLAINQLCRIYRRYCRSECQQQDESRLLEDVLPHVTAVSVHIEAYFIWIRQLQQVASNWKMNFLSQDTTYSEIELYHGHHKSFQNLAINACVPHATVEFKAVNQALSDFSKYFDRLNFILIKYIPEKPKLWRLLTSLLNGYGVTFPQNLHSLLVHSVLLPGEVPEDHTFQALNKPIKLPQNPLFQLQGGIFVSISKDLTLKKLINIVQELEEFLKPIVPYVNMMVLFTLHKSTLFQTYLNQYLEREPKNKLSTNMAVGTGYPDMPDIPPVGVVPCGVSKAQIERLGGALQSTERLLSRLAAGKATYKDITADGHLQHESILITWEFTLIAQFLQLQIESDAGLGGVRDMLELFQFVQHISNMQTVFKKYNIQGCLQDESFSTLVEIMKSLSETSQRAQLTPLQASANLEQVKSILCIQDDSCDCLKLFPAIVDSEPFYNFLDGKKFTGEKGKDKFENEYRLITAQLQHENYNELVLNHLGGAYGFIQPFTQKEQSLGCLMEQVLGFDAANAVIQLKTVNTNIMLIQLWFLRSEGETFENIAHQLNCIINTGYYQFNLSSNRTPDKEDIELVYFASSDSNNGSAGGSTITDLQVSSKVPQDEQTHARSEGEVQKLTREHIDEFVRKLGFLDNEVARRDIIQNFLDQNGIAYKLQDLFCKLRELGHPDYSPSHPEMSPHASTGSLQDVVHTRPSWLLKGTSQFKFPCYHTDPPTTILDSIEKQLNQWREQLTKWHSEYDWLLFLSVPKVLQLHNLLRETKPAVCHVNSEITFLFRNDPNTRSTINDAVEAIIPDLHVDAHAGAMHTVGHFLKELQGRVQCLLSKTVQASKTPHEGTFMLHYGPKYGIMKLTQMIVGIYCGLPHPFEVFHCYHDTTEEELNLFMKRTAKHPLQYLILQVNKLPFKLQEHLLLHSMEAHQQNVESDRQSIMHFVESTPSVLQQIPWINMKEEEDGPTQTIEQCSATLKQMKRFPDVQLVYGNLGDGKTHYIKEQLKKSSFSLTIAVNEAFSVANAINKLRTIPTDVENCAIFFNFTLLPPGGVVDESETQRYNALLEAIGWFFFDFLLLGYVEDRTTGISFHLPGGTKWSIYAEVPVRDLSMNPDDALRQFKDEVPALGLLGNSYFVKPSTPLTITPEVQLLCKYLKAYKEVNRVGEGGINVLYPREIPPATDNRVKFSLDPDLTKQECVDLLQENMDKNIKINKLMQQVFIRYMYRRCAFLDVFPDFNYNQGRIIYTDAKDGTTKERNTNKLGSVLMENMLREVKEFCDPKLNQNWAAKVHHQLIYHYKDGGSSFEFISLQPDQLSPDVKTSFEKIGVQIPSVSTVRSREFLERCLSHALNVPLSERPPQNMGDSESPYVLTLDYTIKMLNIHDRYECGVPVILEGETGVGKTALLDKLRDLWNQSLLLEWKRAQGRILFEMKKHIGVLPEEAVPDYCKCAEVIQRLHEDEGGEVEEEDLILLGLTPDCATPNPAQCFHTLLRKKLLLLKKDPVVAVIENSQMVWDLFNSVEKEDTAESVAKLLKEVFRVKTKHFFYKLNVHSGLKPVDVSNFFYEIIKQAKELQEAASLFDTGEQSVLRLPSVTVFLDEVNTSSCLGLFKEIIVDQSLDGELIPHNIFIVAACNPHRGNSLAVHSDTWISTAYYVRQLHPTFQFLKWDYGSLEHSQEIEYVSAKMKMLQHGMSHSEVASLTDIIVGSHDEMREYARKELEGHGCPSADSDLFSKCCVSQRDIQRVFNIYEKLKRFYEHFEPYGKEQDYNRRAIVVALGIVYYMRLSSQYRKTYADFLDRKVLLGEQVSFSKALEDDMNWFMDRISLPCGIAKTTALKENLFGIIMCTMTRTPLIITGAPGSSKTLSFNLTVANLRGQESKNDDFRHTDLFPKLDQHFYQCSRRTTASEIEKVFTQAEKRQNARTSAKLPVYCVMFMDEAGLPPERHEALKVLHSYLDKPKVSFVAITNHILDAAKTNRAISLYRPDKSTEDLETLTKGCLCSEPENPPPLLKDGGIEQIVNFCPIYKDIMQDSRFNNFFGLRDFIHFINFLRRRIERGAMLSPHLVLQVLERNFNGLEDAPTIWNNFLLTMNAKLYDLKPRSVLKILEESLHDRPQVMSVYNEVRYKLIIDPSEDDSIVRLLFDFGVLERENTQLHMCSNFPGDGQLQKINTIAAIRHSAVQGHTILLSQTDDIHESFYDLFNLRFHHIEHEGGTRSFTYIAIGPITKPIRVHETFQCVVVIKDSEVKNTPAPFLNRFEKYYITHETLLNEAKEKHPPAFRRLLHNALQKTREFITSMEGPSSFYGLRKETLHSLALMMLPFKHKYDRKKTRVTEACADMPLYLLRALLNALRCDANFFIPQSTDEELHLDAKSIFHLIQNDWEVVDGWKYDRIDDAIDEALSILHDENQAQNEAGAIPISLDASIVVCVFQQWVIRYFCKTLMQLMTPEALIHHRKMIPSSYLENYLKYQNHFSLRDVITKSCHMLDQEQNGLSGTPTKVLCITRSSALIHKLLATHSPSSAAQNQSLENKTRLLQDIVYSNPDEVVMCNLSSLQSQSSFQDLLSEFVPSRIKQSQPLEVPKRILVITANMQETSRKVINHLRIMIEEAERQANPTEKKRVFVLLLHFPPTLLSDACYPSLFLRGWNHFYLDSIGHAPSDAVLNVSNWLQLSCFGPDSLVRTKESLVSALMAILRRPDAVARVSSWIPFLTQADTPFSGHMSPAQRHQILLQELLVEKEVGEALCELFYSYWKPAVMVEHLETAADFIYKRESTLNITDSLDTEIKNKFFDFLVYIIAEISEDFNVDIMFEDRVPKEVTKLFTAIVRRMHSLPELSELRSLVSSLTDARRSQCLGLTTQHVTSFPFFRLVSNRMEQVIEESKEEVNKELTLLTEKQQNMHNKALVCQKMLDVVERRISALFESDEKECLSPAIEAMTNADVWERYLSDFIHEKLHIARESTHMDLHMSTEVLKAYFSKTMHETTPLKRFVHLHISVCVYELDFAKLSTILRTLNDITEVALNAETPLSPDRTLTLAQKFLDSVKKTGKVVGTAEDFISFIVSALFSAMCGCISTSRDVEMKKKLQQWYKTYHYVVSMPTFNDFVTAVVQPSMIGTKLTVMQTLYHIIQSNSMNDIHFQQTLQAAHSLCGTYFTATYELKVDQTPLLRDVAAKVFEYLETIDSQDQVEQGRCIMEGLLSHFFLPHTPQPYNLEDCQWFLEFANKHLFWLKTDHTLNSTSQVQDFHTEFQPKTCVPINVLKKYLLQMLSAKNISKQELEDKATDAGPLGLYQPEARELVGKVIMNSPTAGQPGPYIPHFCQWLPHLQYTENALMQQPLAHLYFLSMLECLLTWKTYSLSDLALATEKTTKRLKECRSKPTQVLLYIEKQALLQALLKEVSRHLDPEDSDALRRLFATIDLKTLNKDIGDDLTVESYGLILTMHILRGLQSFHKFNQLFDHKYDSICDSIDCLHPIHARLKGTDMGMFKCLHQFVLGKEGSELSRMYNKVSEQMWTVQRSKGADFQGFVKTAQKFCATEPTQSTAVSEVKKRKYLMILWMCAYFGFFDKKMSSRALVDVIDTHLKDLLPPEYICLIQFFLLPCSIETSVDREDLSRDDEHSESGTIPDDPLVQLFNRSTSTMQDGHHHGDTSLCHAMVVMVAAVLACPAQSNPLWCIMFGSDPIHTTHVMGCTTPGKIGDGKFHRIDYWKKALEGTLNLHSHHLLLWASFSCLSVALLTQPGAESKFAAVTTPEVTPLRKYCTSELRKIWKDFHKTLHISEEESIFLIMSSMKRLYEVGTQHPSPLIGKCVDDTELQGFEKLLHEEIFMPAWTNLKEEFLNYTKLSSTDIFQELKRIDACYPIFQSKLAFTEDVLAIHHALSPSKSPCYLLVEFFLNYERLRVGGTLLPKLIEFYKWLHSQLAYQLTREQAEKYTAKQIVDVVAKHCSMPTRDHLLKLYAEVKDEYNRYIHLSGGVISFTKSNEEVCLVPLSPIDDESTRMIELLSVKDATEAFGVLYNLITHLISAHNHLLKDFNQRASSDNDCGLRCYLPVSDISSVHPTEVSENTAIVVCKSESAYFQQLVRSRCHLPGSSVGGQADWVTSRSILDSQTEPLVDLVKLQSDVVKEYFTGKPLIQCFKSQPFRFRETVPSRSSIKTSVIGSTLDLGAIFQKLPIKFKHELKPVTRKNLEFYFHSSTFHVLQEVVIGLRTVAGHLIKALLDETYSQQVVGKTREIHSQTLSEFLEALYPPYGTLEEVGIERESLTQQQISFLKSLKMEFIYDTLKVFVKCITDGSYDFYDLPYSMKVELPEAIQQQIRDLPRTYGDFEQLLSELIPLSEALKQAGTFLKMRIDDIASEPMMRTIQVPAECKQLGYLIPNSLCVKHYVEFQLSIRNLRRSLEERKQPPAESIQIIPWNEDMLDEVVEMFVRRQTSTLIRKEVKEEYGFPAGDQEKPTIQSDLAKLADAKKHKEVVTFEKEEPDLNDTESSESEILSMDHATVPALDYEVELGRRAKTWNMEDVQTFLDDLGMDVYKDVFEEEGVNGLDVLKMSDKALEEDLEVKSPLHRLKIKTLLKRRLLNTDPKYPVQYVITFLQSVKKFSKYAKSFEENEIDGEMLLDATPKVLEELGVTKELYKTQIQTQFEEYIDTNPFV